MIKTFVISGGQHGYVDRYYHNGSWINVQPWQVREQQGQPPIIVKGYDDGKHKGKLSHNGDAKTHGFYDWVNYLSGYLDEENVTFEELEHVAEIIGWKSAFDRRVYEFWATNVGRHLRPTLVTMANNYPIHQFSGAMGAAAYAKHLQSEKMREKGIQNAYDSGPVAVYFDYEPPIIGAQATEPDESKQPTLF